MDRFRRRYGASPLHLAALLACFAVAGYAAVRLLGARPAAVLLWFVGAALLHDLVLAPIYTLLDRAAGRRPPPSWWNHVRFPAAISLLLLLVWFPEIARRSHGYGVTTGLDQSVYLNRWLAVCAALFALSALALLARVLRRRRSTGRRSGAAP